MIAHASVISAMYSRACQKRSDEHTSHHSMGSIVVLAETQSHRFLGKRTGSPYASGSDTQGCNAHCQNILLLQCVPAVFQACPECKDCLTSDDSLWLQTGGAHACIQSVCREISEFAISLQINT